MIPADDNRKSLQHGPEGVMAESVERATSEPSLPIANQIRNNGCLHICPDCGDALIPGGGCFTCFGCGWGFCG